MDVTVHYGPVYVTDGPHKGRIGHYDDEHALTEGEAIDTEFEEVEGWELLEDDDDEKILEVAIVYFGDWFLSESYSYVIHKWLRPITTDDLFKRREELSRTQGLFAIDNELDDKQKLGHFRELHFVETVLVDRMVEVRYSNNTAQANVFISHASADKKFARWIATDLKAAGHSPWLDEWAISIGESIPQKISQGLNECDFVVVVLSERATKSRWVENEWQTKYWDEVNNGTVQVLPVLFEDCVIPELLKAKRYADFRNNYNNGLDDLLLAIDKLSLPA